MEFTWDEEKNRTNLQKHGLDFRDAQAIFEGPTITLVDDRFDYGEARFITLGMLQEFVVVIAHTELKSPVRLISMRKGAGQERSFYEKEVLFRYQTPPEDEG